MTFFGESIGLAGYAILAGPVDASALYYGVEKVDDGLTVTVNAGDSFILMVSSAISLTEADVIGGLKWVLRASGAGVLDLADARDPAWGSGASFTALPSVTVSDTVLTDYPFDASPSLRDNALLIGTGEAIQLRVTVASGSVTLDKVRLQIEPVGGIAGGGWSGWVLDDGDVYSHALAPDRYELTDAFPQVQGNNNVTTPGAYPGPQVSWVAHLDNGAYGAQIGHIYGPSDGWRTWRPGYPYGLDALTLGVDYAQRPDLTPADDNLYAEWVTGGVNYITGWSIPDVAIEYYNGEPTAAYPYTPAIAPLTSLEVEVYANLSIPQVAPQAAVFPGVGSGTIHIASLIENVSTDMQGNPGLAVPVGNPGRASTIGIFARTTDFPNVQLPNAGEEFSVGGRAWFYPGGAVAVLVAMPQYRYWIPQLAPIVPPNQHMQRRDGLGRGGVPMARGNATRQASNAARGTY